MSPRLCIIPTNADLSGHISKSTSDKQAATADSSVISLPHPRTAVPTRYLLHPTRGLHEFTKLPPSSTNPRSWLLCRSPTDNTTNTNNNQPSTEEATQKPRETEKGWIGTGQVIQDGSLYLTTPIDPLLLLLPHLLPESTENEGEGQYMPLDDLVETLVTATKTEHWGHVIRPGTASRRHVDARIRAVSDSVDVGGGEEMAYRASKKKVLRALAKKCKAMAGDGGLPKSLEEEFVVKPLVRPVSISDPSPSLLQPNNESAATTSATTIENQQLDPAENGVQEGESEQQTSEQLPTPAELTKSVSEPVIPEDEASARIRQLLRLRVSMQYLSASYLPPHVATHLETHLAALHDFRELDIHLAKIKKLRLEAVATRSGDFTMKRSLDDETADDRAEKKRKKDEEEKKKKKNISRGVRDLNKVNTRGMSKMTSFFTKK